MVCKDKHRHRQNFACHTSLHFFWHFWCRFLVLWTEPNKHTNMYHTSFRSNLIIFNPAHVFGFYHNASSTFLYTTTITSTTVQHKCICHTGIFDIFKSPAVHISSTHFNKPWHPASLLWIVSHRPKCFLCVLRCLVPSDGNPLLTQGPR